MTEITLDTLSGMPVGELAALPATKLMSLVKKVDDNLKQAKLAKGWVDNALKLKYEEHAIDVRQRIGRQAGVIHFVDEGVKVTATLPKKVRWDQDRLRLLAQQIQSAGDDPKDYLNVTYEVPERRYTAWSEPIRHFFDQARTFCVGKQTFKLQPNEEDLL